MKVGNRWEEGSVFVSFKTQEQLIPEALQFLLIFVKDQQNVLDQIVQVLELVWL